MSQAWSLWQSSEGAPLRPQDAAEPDRDADPLMANKTTTAEAPAPKRRRADADRSVAAILDAGLEALASDPDSSMSEIARRAGVVRATIYVHFPTRETLLDAVMEYAIGQVVESMRGAEPQRGEPVEALERVLRATWRQLGQFPACSPSTRRGSRPRSYTGVSVPMLDQLEPLIKRGQKQRRLPQRSSRFLAARRDPLESSMPQATRSAAGGLPGVRSRDRHDQHDPPRRSAATEAERERLRANRHQRTAPDPSALSAQDKRTAGSSSTTAATVASPPR